MAVSPAWLFDITDELIASAYGDDTFRSGRQYAEDGRVKHLVASDDGERVRGLVRGQDSNNYRVTLDRTPPLDGGPTWGGTCTCPVRKNCKHCVAILIASRTSDRIPKPSAGGPVEPTPVAVDQLANWRVAMDAILGTAQDPTSTATELVMGLQFQRATSTRQNATNRIKVRPVSQVEPGKWVPQGVTWYELTQPDRRPPVQPEQLSAFRNFWEAYQSHATRTGARPSVAEIVHLDDVGPNMWRLLRAMTDAGVTLVGHREGPVHVTLSADNAVPTLDVVRRDSENLSVRGVLRVADTTLPSGAVTLLGDPAHGVMAMEHSTRTAAEQLTLIELRQPVDGPMLQMLRTNRKLTIAADDVAHFTAAYAPALRAKMPVQSSDQSVDLPAVGDPVLGLYVSYSADRHVATLTWTADYPVSDYVVSVPISAIGKTTCADVPVRFPRDHAREEQLLTIASEISLPRSARHHPDAPDTDPVDAHCPSPPLPVATLSAADTALFSHSHLPQLHDRPDVRVTITGEPPTFRASATVPQVELQEAEATDADDWFSLSIKIIVDGQEVPLAEVISAMAHGDDAVVLDTGVWFSLEHPALESLRRIVAEARELIDVDAGTVGLNMFRADLWGELIRDGVVTDAKTTWLQRLRGLVSLDAIEDPAPAAGLQAELRPYQHDGYRWLSFLWDHRLGGILADDMGLGKTMQTLAAICRQHDAGNLDGPVLIVAPTSVVATWQREAAKFAPHLRAAAITQTAGKRGTTIAGLAEDHDIIITSYTLLRLDAEEYQEQRWAATIFDEAQFVKNYSSATYRAARKLPATFRLAVTGTPLENSLMDLWALLSLTTPGLFPDPTEFTSTFRRPIESGKAPERLAQLRRRIRPFVLRRSKSQVATDLPPKIEQVLTVTLTPEHREIYDKHLSRERQRVLGLLDDMTKNRMAIFRSLTKLRQLALDPSLVDEEYKAVTDGSKLGVFVELMQELLAEGHRALVFSQFTSYLSIVRAELQRKNIEYAYLDGSTRDRQGAINQFTEQGAPVFLISLKAGGFGLTLTEADYVFVLDPWWNPAAESQAIDRAHRIGQDKTVMVYRLMATDTIEEKVLALQDRKRALFDQVVDEGEMLATALSADDVRSLFEPATPATL